MKIGFVTNDWSRTLLDGRGLPCLGGSGFIRIGQYVPYLNKLGHSAVVGTAAFNKNRKRFGVYDFNGGSHFDCDVIIMQRYMHRNALDDVINAVSSGQIVLNDIDDWYWGLSERNHAYDLTHPDKNKNENIDIYKAIVENSSGIITSTPFLTKRMLEWNANVLMHQNYVTTKMFTRRTVQDKNKVVVGWMGSTSHRSGDLEILRECSKKISSIASWHHTGHLDAPGVPKFWDAVKVSSGHVSRTSFLRPYELDKGMRFDIGLVPLTDVSFNEAKSWIKGLEYASAGIPFIASPSSEYVRLHEEYGIGLIAETPNDFYKHVKRLSNFRKREEESEKVYLGVKALDVSVGAPKFINTIERLCSEAR